jgi:hypothetical protein
MSKMKINETEISVFESDGKDYICLTDMIKSKDGDFFITDWLRNRNTIDYIAAWEKLNNPDFNYGEFAIITNNAGKNSFKISVKDLVEKCNVKCITSKTGRYGGTYAHRDIAFQFGMWISPEFQLLLVTEFQRLKEEETKRLESEWDYKRFLSKANHVVHTDSVKNYVIPKITDEEKKKWAYATEADLLNIALFGFTAAQWRQANPKMHMQKLNVRDLADAHELLVLSNLESLNAILNEQGIDVHNKLDLLRKAAKSQLESLRASSYTIDKIKSPFKIEEKKKTDFNSNLKGLLNVPPPKKDDK